MVLKKSHREVGRALENSSGFVSSAITRAAAKGLTTWAEVEALAEAVIEERLYGPKVKAGAARPLPDPAHIHAE